MHLQGRPVSAFDPEGLIFAAGVNSESIKLYDLRSFDKGPFVTFLLNQEKECDWTGLKFSKDGKTILISTNGSIVRLIDAFHGTPLQTFTGEWNTQNLFSFNDNFFLQVISTIKELRLKLRSAPTHSSSSLAAQTDAFTFGTPIPGSKSAFWMAIIRIPYNVFSSIQNTWCWHRLAQILGSGFHPSRKNEISPIRKFWFLFLFFPEVELKKCCE